VVVSRLFVIVALLVAIALAPAMATYVSGVSPASTPVFTGPTLDPPGGADPVPIEPFPAGDDDPSRDRMAPATTLPPSPRTPPADDGDVDDDTGDGGREEDASADHDDPHGEADGDLHEDSGDGAAAPDHPDHSEEADDDPDESDDDPDGGHES
jgi:hypothetical protein